MKHKALWIYSIGWGMILGTCIGMFLAPSVLIIYITTVAFLAVILGMIATPPEDWEYLLP